MRIKNQNKIKQNLSAKTKEQVNVQRNQYIERLTPYQEHLTAMLSNEKLFDGSLKSIPNIKLKMESYANACLAGHVNQLLAAIANWELNMQNSAYVCNLYLSNFKAGTASFVRDLDFYNTAKQQHKKYKNYIVEWERLELEELMANPDEYRPEMWGKQTNISQAAPEKWVYFLKGKNAFKPRNGALLETMRNDLRIYLQQQNPPVVIDNKANYQKFIYAIVNAFVPNTTDMYAQNLVSSKHILSGITKFNKCINGDLSRKLFLDKERKLAKPTTEL